MSRIGLTFKTLAAAHKKALIPYITAGDFEPGLTVPLMHAMVETGADILELGVPFSDPMADGPVIQAACERALKHRTSLGQVLEMVAVFRQSNTQTPVVLMGYTNPIEAMGYEKFAECANQSGVDGLLTVDLPPEESGDFLALLKTYAIDPIFLLSPTTTAARMEKICRAASGFLYYVSLKGVTGAATLNLEEVSEKLSQIRRYTDLPVGVGFGIKNPETAQAVARFADAVVVGSAIVQCLAENVGKAKIATDRIKSLLVSMRKAIDTV